MNYYTVSITRRAWLNSLDGSAVKLVSNPLVEDVEQFLKDSEKTLLRLTIPDVQPDLRWLAEAHLTQWERAVSIIDRGVAERVAKLGTFWAAERELVKTRFGDNRIYRSVPRAEDLAEEYALTHELITAGCRTFEQLYGRQAREPVGSALLNVTASPPHSPTPVADSDQHGSTGAKAISLKSVSQAA